MKTFAWNSEKNDLLVKERGVSFERIVFLVEHGGLLDIIAHPDSARYPNQQILIVNLDQYAWLVPFVESTHRYFLKTIIPSRKATKKYLEARDD
ncbi:MAG: BrnT family toxin [Salinisphaera sp.]|nr:BrnT family toxin [Salinisphaera sp.]